MKKISLLFITTLSFQFFLPFGRQAFSQGGIWTWISGSSLPSFAGAYGIQGTPSVNNSPPGAYEYTEWKDKSGNFWIYGGTYPMMSDLWKFNPQTLEWTWMKGSGMQYEPPVHGIKGVSDPQNTPGERNFGTVSWTDTSGNLWLFGGGASTGTYSDLWKYDISTNEWTWINGPSFPFAFGNLGVKGVPGPFIEPGARAEVATAWTDTLNNLWLFGGAGNDGSGSSGDLNDLMKYNISTDEWTWMAGSNGSNVTPVWGTKNVSLPSNDPGGRCSFTHNWTDASGGLWMMGGMTLYSGMNFLNDVWRYDMNTNEWTWKAGENSFNDSGSYQSTCDFDSIHMPLSRGEHRASVQDFCGRFWLYGGQNYISHGREMNDLWIFDPVSLQWALLSGNNSPIQQPAYNFGTRGIPALSNSPPRRSGAVAWWGNDNRFYLYGGIISGWNYVTWGDMWMFTPDSTCAAALCMVNAFAQFSAPDSICPGSCINFTNLSLNATSFQWQFPGALPDSSDAMNPTNICYPSAGTFDVILIASNSLSSDTLLLTSYINIYPSPPPQGISQSGDTLFANPGAGSYQWYYNGNTIAGATSYFHVAMQSGDYNVIVTDSNDCEVEAVINDVIADVSQLAVRSLQLAIFPNPVVDKFTIQKLQVTSGTAIEVSVYNVLGEKIFLDVDLESMTVNCRSLKPGIYFLELTTEIKSYRSKFIKE